MPDPMQPLVSGEPSPSALIFARDPSILQAVVSGSRSEFHPLQCGRRDQLLRGGWKCGQKIVSANRIELAENIIDKKKRGGISGLFKSPCLSKFHRQRH